MDLMTAIDAIPGIGPFLPYLILIGFGCALVASCMPPPTDNSSAAYRFAYQFINKIGANFGHAKNATAPVATPKES